MIQATKAKDAEIQQKKWEDFLIRDAHATQKLEEFQARKKAEAEAGKYKAEIR